MCRYCGSWNPAEFKEWLPQVDGLTHWVELNDRCDKIYIHRPDIANAEQGAIKFKTAHIQGDPQLITLLNDALRTSMAYSEERLDRILKRHYEHRPDKVDQV